MEYNDQIKNRLHRIDGQLGGVIGMMELEKDCRGVVTQLSAIRSAVDRVMGLVVANNMEEGIIRELDKGNNPEPLIKEAVDLLVKSK
ncbi:metal-sensitive transcriptional regulator [Aneurinibacillus sp. Ricciae_BoGa-3]|uniref:metal-sensitive transcriptional regulator n=1 Tax=Aneurinibacillus sp. Ricciae_BoGa-3 TaxID=3022697 RepID=UPI0023407C5B|nr:metal-sensitive transcriptional regulator [Aneurinibacillus sp. Ricciae_BoGa-3]WCK56490.1 metal-sensitive transcriptional regulator [Aneurinibacillus sp. Ricciae_BoGa-3]